MLLEISRSIWDVAAAEAPPPEERLPQEAMELAHAVQRVSASVDFSSVWSGGEVTIHRRPLARWHAWLRAMTCGCGQVANDARLEAVLCYALNNGELHNLPVALAAGSVVGATLQLRYDEVAVVRWSMAREALSEALPALRRLQGVRFQLALNWGALKGASAEPVEPVYN